MAGEHPAIIWQRHIVAEHAVLAPNMLVAFEFATTDGAGACPVSLTPLTTTPRRSAGGPRWLAPGRPSRSVTSPGAAPLHEGHEIVLADSLQHQKHC